MFGYVAKVELLGLIKRLDVSLRVKDFIVWVWVIGMTELFLVEMGKFLEGICLEVED